MQKVIYSQSITLVKRLYIVTEALVDIYAAPAGSKRSRIRWQIQ
jgi:hypothetical protein